MKKIVILGAGESGAGAAVLAKKEGFEVFVSDMSKIKDNYKKLMDDHNIEWEEGHHTEEKILDADGKKVVNAYLFDKLKIKECGEEYMAHQGRYPVINLSLKSGKQPTYEMAAASLVDEIAKEFKRHRYVLSSEKLTPNDRERFTAMMNYKVEKIGRASCRERV